MKPETFFDNFEALAEALNGVQKLRELILQLAVRGKLVPQDEKDEPAAVLLKRIKIERDRLIKERKIKNTEPLPPIDSDELKYSIPKSWQWVHLGEIGQVVGGGTPDTKNPDYFVEKGISWLTPADLYGLKHKYIGRGRRDLSEKGLKESSAQLMPAGTVIFSSRAPIGYVAITKNDLATNQGFKSLTPYIIEMNEYIYYFLKKAGKEIDESASGTTFKEIPGKEFVKVQIPLPPLAEQHRIVAKVDQLMSLCDELEARQQKKRESRAHLNSAALDRLLAHAAPGEFAEGWRRINDNFDLLYDAPENVGALRKAILQLAVMGKLVMQDANDEPASVLLGKIKAEKERLIKEEKVNKGKPLPIEVGDLLYVAPNGWEWIRLQEIGEFCGGSTPSTNKSEYWGGGMAWVSPKDMKEKRIRASEFTISDKALQETRLRIIPKNSILIVARSGILKRLLPIAINDIECTVNQDLKVLIPFIPQISDYLQLMLKGHEKFILKKLVKGGMTVQSLKYSEFEQQPFPLPPLAEQRRIVARVDQLMSLCDELEAGLLRSQAEGERLMEAVVGRMLAGK